MAKSTLEKKRKKRSRAAAGQPQSPVRKINISGTYILGIVVAVFLVVMSVQIYQLKQKEIAYQQREATLQIEYEEETQRAKEIDAMSEYMKTTQYIEDTAKSKLGLAYENEIIFKEKE